MNAPAKTTPEDVQKIQTSIDSVINRMIDLYSRYQDEKEYEDLKVKVSRMRDLQQPSILHDRGFSISARRDVTHINFDSSIFRRVVERRQTKKELPNYSRFYISSKNCAEGLDDCEGIIMREDSLSRAFLHSNRLLSNLQRK